MLIDAFPFATELDILEIRLNSLNKYVDYFILVESEKTQTLRDKPLYFELNKERYKSFLDKIIHIKILADECKVFNPNSWEMEHFQRNCITRGIKQINPTDRDYLMISDADEIPDLSLIPDTRENLTPVCSFDMTYHTFYANLLTQNKRWIGTVLTPIVVLNKMNPQAIRDAKDSIKNKIIGGWHLGYMGGKEAVYKKFLNCIEPMDKSLIPPFEVFCEEFDRKIKNGGSFLFSDKIDDSIKLNECAIEYPLLPEYLTNNKEKFKHLFWI